MARIKAAQDKRGEIGENLPDFASPIYHPLNESLSLEFKTNLELIGGEVVLCQTKTDVGAEILRAKPMSLIFIERKSSISIMGVRY